ncbi:MAG: hypothetical protein CSA21_04845 [Deltaproteobacteria bacterium]|nr:MAG: hypothetical protein CSA21_04845 [Deltaproteobacteria bacterium]
MHTSPYISCHTEGLGLPVQVSETCRPCAQAPDTSFQERLDQIATSMDLHMAHNLAGGEAPGKEREDDLFSQAFNLQVLTTLTKLSQQQGAFDHPAKRTEDVGAQVQEVAAHILNRGSRGDVTASPSPQGTLAEMFESGGQCDAIGYDQQGGTSYGTYQIASRPGTMDLFIDFLRQEVPAWAERLEQAGPADTGSDQGIMPTVWRAIAQEEPDLFGELQHRFITATHYQPALEHIRETTGLGEHLFAAPLQEVLFSTAVQHGPSGTAAIFSRALNQLDATGTDNPTARLIEQIYKVRTTQFTSSSPLVQSSVSNRLNQEALLAQRLMDSMLT